MFAVDSRGGIAEATALSFTRAIYNLLFVWRYGLHKPAESRDSVHNHRGRT
jgi:hypothetical protein